MLTGEKRSQIDRIWNAFWTEGIFNPLTVIEQITYLLFIKRLDDQHTAREKKSALLHQPIENSIYTDAQQQLRWSRFKNREAEDIYRLFTQLEGVFDFMKTLGGEAGNYPTFTPILFSSFFSETFSVNES